jgi:hypothetical protein
VAELSASARAAVGPARADVDVRLVGVLVGLVLIGAAFVISWAAEGTSRRNLYWQLPFTELESAAQDIQAHLATGAELVTRPVSVPVLYPDRTAPGVTATMHQGWAQHASTLPAPSIQPW